MTKRRAIAVTVGFTITSLSLPIYEVLAHGRSALSLGVILAVTGWLMFLGVVWHERWRTSTGRSGAARRSLGG
jgi:hypothetical protein